MNKVKTILFIFYTRNMHEHYHCSEMKLTVHGEHFRIRWNSIIATLMQMQCEYN